MKKIILWLVKVFKIEINNTISVPIVKKVPAIIKDDIVYGDLLIEGKVLIKGTLTATDDIICYKK